MADDRMPIGDFNVFDDDFQEAQQIHQQRSSRERRQDNSKRARVTEDFGLWQSDPDSFDFPGVDTPSDNPRIAPKDKPFLMDDEEDDNATTGLQGIIADSKGPL